MFGSGDVRELRMWTTDLLSIRNIICLRDQPGPQTWAAKTTGKKLLVSNGQWKLESRPLTIEPFIVHKSTITNSTSELMEKSGKGSRVGKRKNDIPFHWPKHSTHQARAFLNSTLRRIGWETLQTQDNKSIIRRRKVWPLPNHHARVMQLTNQRLKIFFSTTFVGWPVGESLLQSRKLISWKACNLSCCI